MVYGLIAVVGIGATTLLSVHPTRNACLQEAAMINESRLASTQCWPAENKQELERKVEQINDVISSVTIRR